MARRRGATGRDPKVRAQPVKDKAKQIARNTGDALTGNKSSEQINRAVQRAANRAPMERLSPGVYRSAGGGLVTQQGRPIQRQPQAPTQPAQPQSSGMQMESGYYKPELQQDTSVGQQLINQMGQQVNKPFPMDGLGNFNPSSVGKTPPGWPGNQMNTMEYRYPTPQGMPQMPQPSANMGGQYRLSPGVYGTREQAMNQYNQQMQQMWQPAMPMRRGQAMDQFNLQAKQRYAQNPGESAPYMPGIIDDVGY